MAEDRLPLAILSSSSLRNLSVLFSSSIWRKASCSAMYASRDIAWLNGDMFISGGVGRAIWMVSDSCSVNRTSLYSLKCWNILFWVFLVRCIVRFSTLFELTWLKHIPLEFRLAYNRIRTMISSSSLWLWKYVLFSPLCILALVWIVVKCKSAQGLQKSNHCEPIHLSISPFIKVKKIDVWWSENPFSLANLCEWNGLIILLHLKHLATYIHVYLMTIRYSYVCLQIILPVQSRYKRA